MLQQRHYLALDVRRKVRGSPVRLKRVLVDVLLVQRKVVRIPWVPVRDEVDATGLRSRSRHVAWQHRSDLLAHSSTRFVLRDHRQHRVMIASAQATR